MNTEPLRTCTHLHDTGQRCNSAAARGRDFCVFHLRHHARLMRMAQARARAERFDLRLPAIDSMATVVVAINQVLEAVAADMIDLKRADFLLKTLRFAAQALRHSDKWPASPFHSDQPAEIDLAQDYGLPADIDLNTPPETAFPPRGETLGSVILNGGGAPSAPPESKDPFFSARDIVKTTGGPQLPDVGSCGDVNSDSSDIFGPGHMVSPDTLEIAEIYKTVSPEAATLRMRQLERNRHRRELTANRKRFEQMAARLNLRNAAERLAQKKVAELKARDEGAKKPPASADPNNDTQIAERSPLTPTGSIG